MKYEIGEICEARYFVGDGLWRECEIINPKRSSKRISPDMDYLVDIPSLHQDGDSYWGVAERDLRKKPRKDDQVADEEFIADLRDLLAPVVTV